MEIADAKVVADHEGLKVVLPLTRPTGKIRIKERTFFCEYGLPTAGRSVTLGLKHYVEWQIGYDLVANDANKEKTTLRDFTFVDYKGECKYAYELSEILYYSVRRGLIAHAQIEAVHSKIRAVPISSTLEMLEDMAISRTNPRPTILNGMDFYRMTMKYPLLVHKFGQYDIYAEVMIREKQRAVGTQAMLYVCLPLVSLRFKSNVVGRALDAKETAEWAIGRDEALLALEIFRIFGMLSPKHRFDVLAILDMIVQATQRF